MRYLSWFAKLVLFVLLLGFALKNTEPVAVRYFLGQEWRAPLSLVLLLFFGVGVVLSAAALFGALYRARRELDALRRGEPGGNVPPKPLDITSV